MTPCLGGSQFNMKNPLNPEHNPFNQDPTGRNSMGSKFNPTPAATLISIVEKSIIDRCFIRKNYDKILMETGEFSNIRNRLKANSNQRESDKHIYGLSVS